MTSRRAALVGLVVVVGLGATQYCRWVSERDHFHDAVFKCMIDGSKDEYSRCAHQVTVGDVDGNGEVNWHDAYVFDHCQRCPECCVNEADFKDDAPSGLDRIAEEAFCTPDVCPGKCCYCVKDDDGVWWIDETRFGTDDDPDCGIPIPVDEDEDSGCGEGEGEDEGINR